MKDPVIEKLKTDAGIVITDLWRALRQQPPVEDDWMRPRTQPADLAESESTDPGQSGSSHFHAN